MTHIYINDKTEFVLRPCLRLGKMWIDELKVINDRVSVKLII